MTKKLFLVIFAILGTLCVLNAQKVYDFKDGTIIGNGASDDGTLTLSGDCRHHGTQYGMDMRENAKISITVDGDATIKFLGSKHSSLNLTGVGPAGEALGTQYTKTTTDLVDTYDFVYAGAAGTLEFTAEKYNGSGSNIYLPQITVVPAQMGHEAATAEKNIIYNFDFRDGSIVETTTDGKSDMVVGLVSITAGSQNAYAYHGTDHGSVFKAGNEVILQVAGNSYIKVGGCQYSGGTISASSSRGTFEQSGFDAKTGKCYHQDGTTIDFLYVGDAGAVMLDFTSTTYVPYIQIVPFPYDVDLAQWVQKSGTITVNGVEINLTSGATATNVATVTVSEGMVVSATADEASIRINLGGNALSTYTPTYSGDISAVSVSGDALIITYTDDTTKPESYKINVADNSKTVISEKGKTYTYNFADGSVLPQTAYTTLRYKTFVSSDGILTINSNTDTEAIQFGYHDASHGAVLYSGNSMDFVVAGDATISIGTCQYGASNDAIFTFTDESGTVLGTIQAKESEGACGSRSFSYTGEAGVVTATLTSESSATGEFYFHNVSVANAAEIIKTTKTDVWDFGAAQFDEELYNNNLTEAVINGWYTAEPGSTNVTMPSGFTAGVLSWVGGGNDRLRTSNTNLTRYDANGSPVDFEGETFTGSLYVNASAASNRYFGLTLAEDDEVTLYAKTQSGGGRLTFEYIGDDSQKDVVNVGSDLEMIKFVAKKQGAYHIYDAADKPSYYRVLRKDATYVTISGSINTAGAAGLPANYNLVITNEAGKEFTQALTPGSASYSIKLPAGYAYTLGLGNANGYIITNGTTVTVTENLTKDIVIEKINTNNLSGAIEGLTSAQLEGVTLTFTPDEERIYVPTPVVDKQGLTYSVDIEPNYTYTISATGINDYYITNNTVNISANATQNIVFALKPVFKIDINAGGLNTDQASKLSVTFTNMNESGYVYTFTDLSNINLRDGVYSISCSGLDEYPLQLGATSNLTVNGAATSKTLAFTPVNNWPFNDAVITNGTTTAYKGMLFAGTAYNEIGKGHLVIKDQATVKVPVNPGEKLIITYYYSAKFTVDGGDVVETASGSTSQYESVQYVYSGSEAGYMTIQNVEGTTYITDVTTAKVVAYVPAITVGTDKQYQTINDALAAVRAMDRPNAERVKIMVDPGNYEEMLIIDMDSVSIINASATPSIALQNQGVDINENAVRITSYYGHGYNYYSMGTNQKWSADALRVNTENGYTTYSNTGSGTGNGSYWNATVVVSGKGFEASHIIFENSFNQYISKKESEDVVEEWASGGKGTRPTDQGNTAVQNKSFVERAAAIAYLASGDKSVLYKCRIVGRQDSFYGAEGARVVTYKGSLMGGTDYLFGGMTLVAYQSDLAMNTSETNTDVAYITAAQQSNARGYLLYECTVTSAQPGTETASQYLSKPGYFGRPWQANTSEAVFYNTTIKTTDNPNNAGKSMIVPVAWLSTLGGESVKSYEYGTIEESGEDNSASRATWSQVLSTPKLSDGTDITTFNFTKGGDQWDPIPALIERDETGIFPNKPNADFSLIQAGNIVKTSGINAATNISIYGITGILSGSFTVATDTEFQLNPGFWIVKASNAKGQTVLKTMIP